MNREEHLLKNISDVLSYKNILYVGAKHIRMECGDLFKKILKVCKWT